MNDPITLIVDAETPAPAAIPPAPPKQLDPAITECTPQPGVLDLAVPILDILTAPEHYL